MSDFDVKYLRDKGIAALLEQIAAEIVVKKPADPEQFLRERYAADGTDETAFRPGDAVKLFTVPLDPPSLAVVLAAALAKVPATVIDVDVPTAGSAAAAATAAGRATPGAANAEFLALSPFHRAPLLDHNGVVVLECGPVARYLTARTAALPPAGTRERAKVESALDTVLACVLADATAAVHERVLGPRRNNRPVDMLGLQAAVGRARTALTTLQAGSTFFRDSPWLVGRQPTVADAALAAAVFSLQNTAGYDCIAGLEKVGAWWAAVQAEAFYTEAIQPFAAMAAKLHTK